MIIGGNSIKFLSTGILVMVLSLFNYLNAQYNKYFLQHFTQINGLPQNSVNQLYFDGNNYLWIATEAGLARFDGINFYNFTVGIIKNFYIIRDKIYLFYLHVSPESSGVICIVTSFCRCSK